MSLHEISLNEGLDKLQRVFVERGLDMPKISIVTDDGKHIHFIKFNSEEIPPDAPDWVGKILYDFAKRVEGIIKTMPDLLANFMKDGGEFYLGNEHHSISSEYLSKFKRNDQVRVHSDGFIERGVKDFRIKITLDDLMFRGGNLLAHELMHHIDVAFPSSPRHNFSEIFRVAEQADKFLRDDISFVSGVEELIQERGYRRNSSKEKFAVLGERICNNTPPKSPIFLAYAEIVKADLEYLLTQPEFTPEKDYAGEVISDLRISKEVVDRLIKLSELTSKPENIDKLKRELEKAVVEEIIGCANELRQKLNLAPKEISADNILKACQPQQAR